MAAVTDPLIFLRSLSPHTPPDMIYILAGEEEYYIDKLEKRIVETYLEPEAIDFSFKVFYGMEANTDEILATARRFPMMSRYNIVVVREAQYLSHLDLLQNLADFPVPTTILILSFKGKMPDGRSKFVKSVREKFKYIESKKIYDNQLNPHIAMMAEEKGLKISLAACNLLAENIGSNLQRLSKEIDKLRLIPDAQGRTLSEEDIRQYTSVSKVFNNFELLRALAIKDAQRSMMIALNLADEQKKVPVQTTIGLLFNYFSLLLIAAHSSDKSERGLMATLDIKARFQVINYVQGIRKYSPTKIRHILSYIRHSDARSKGMYGGDPEAKEILNDLIYFILH